MVQRNHSERIFYDPSHNNNATRTMQIEAHTCQMWAKLKMLRIRSIAQSYNFWLAFLLLPSFRFKVLNKTQHVPHKA